MSDTTTQDNGLDINEAGSKIASMLGMASRRDIIANGDAESPVSPKVETEKELPPLIGDDLGQSESDATEYREADADEQGDSPDDETSETDPPAIAPPKHLTSEEQAKFSKLPPEAQELFNQLSETRESQQNKAFDRRMQDIAAKDRALQAQVQAVNAERAQREQQLQTLAALTVPQIEELKHVNWDELATYNQDEYIRLSHVANSINQRVQAINGELQRIEGEKLQQQQHAINTHHAQQLQVAFETIPEWQLNVNEQGVPVGLKDETKAKALADGIKDLLHAYDFEEKDTPAIWQDARITRMIRDHVVLRREKAARMGAQSKKTIASAPTYMKPSAPTNSDGKNRRYKETKAAFDRSRSIEDAGALINMMLR